MRFNFLTIASNNRLLIALSVLLFVSVISGCEDPKSVASADVIDSPLPIDQNETIYVGHEVALLLDGDGEAMTVKMLKLLEAKTNYKFIVEPMNYKRAKLQLKNGKIDLLLHTPHESETKEYYTYGAELKWNLFARADFYSLNPNLMKSMEILRESNATIAVPRGNEDFCSEATEIPIDRFRPVETVEQMVRKLKLGRVDVIWFERHSIMDKIVELKVPDVHYISWPAGGVSIGIGIQRSAKGKALGARLDLLLQKLDTADLFDRFHQFQSLPRSGSFDFNKYRIR